MPELSILAERCSHQRIAHAQCTACVAACPRSAWRMHPDGLGFDPDACDDCGLCVAACPLEALALPAPVPIITATQPRSLLLACDHSAVQSSGASAGQVACIHALGPDLLLDWASRHHARTIRLATGDCSGCARNPANPADTLQARWRPVAQRAAAQGLPAPVLGPISAAQWQALTRKSDQPDPRRRRFLGGLLTPPSASGVTPSVPAAARTSGRQQLVRRFQRETTRPPAPPLWWVQVKPARCTGCLACQAVCPAQAFELHSPEPDPTDDRPDLWTLKMDDCTGCGLCLDLCETAALTLHGPEQARTGPPQQVRLARKTCPSCGVAYRQPVRPGPLADSRCPTCQRGRPARQDRLVQSADSPAGAR